LGNAEKEVSFYQETHLDDLNWLVNSTFIRKERLKERSWMKNMSDRIYKATVKTGLIIHINSNNVLNRYKKRCVLFSPDKMQTQFSRNKTRDSHTHFVKQVLCLPWVPNNKELQPVTVPPGLKIGQKPLKTPKILIEKTKPRTIP
jgi:hypothetical protein